MTAGPILLTGFEPFGEHRSNPSERIATALDRKLTSAGTRIQGCVLPVDKNRAAAILAKTIEKVQPSAVIALGVSASRPLIAPEKVALNFSSFAIPDNADNQPASEPVIDDGPAAYFTTLPAERMVEELRKERVPAALSLSAGSYVCNHVFYSLMHLLDQSESRIPAGFIHCPVESTDGDRGLPLEQMICAIRLCCDLLAKPQTEACKPLGGVDQAKTEDQ